MRLTVESDSSVPPYEQLRRQLAQLAGGELPPGTRLPTVRDLAAQLGLAANTVARAYRELESSGLLETRGRAGTFIAAGADRTAQRARDLANRYVEETRRLGLSTDQSLRYVRAALGLIELDVARSR
ncbi:MAG: GntR family transcriptional regulator [Actinocatenispora sp.]